MGIIRLSSGLASRKALDKPLLITLADLEDSTEFFVEKNIKDVRFRANQVVKHNLGSAAAGEYHLRYRCEQTTRQTGHGRPEQCPPVRNWR